MVCVSQAVMVVWTAVSKLAVAVVVGNVSPINYEKKMFSRVA